MSRKPKLNIDTGNLLLKHAMFRHTMSGSIDFIQKSWKVGATGLKERSPIPGYRSDDKIHPFHQLVIQPNEIKIIKELGVGGSSTVYLISYRGSQFALKIINMDDEKHQFKSAQSEIDTLRTLDSKYVVKMWQAFIRNRRIAIILDHMNASSLDVAYMKCNNQLQRVSLAKPSHHQVRGISDIEVLSSITSHIILCFIAMKEKKICHRDVKPSNFLLHSFSEEEGIVKLTDFGLAKVIGENESCSEIVGTFKYHSPERLMYMNYDHSSDIWSLGVTIAEAYLGRYPFQHQLETMEEDEFRNFLCNDPLNDSSFPKHLFPEELFHFVALCMKKNPQERPSPEILLQHPFLRHAQSEEHSRAVIGRWISKTNLEMPKQTQPVQIKTPKQHRNNAAQQFFSVAFDQEPITSTSFGGSFDINSSMFTPSQSMMEDGLDSSVSEFGGFEPMNCRLGSSLCGFDGMEYGMSGMGGIGELGDLRDSDHSHMNDSINGTRMQKNPNHVHSNNHYNPYHQNHKGMRNHYHQNHFVGSYSSFDDMDDSTAPSNDFLLGMSPKSYEHEFFPGIGDDNDHNHHHGEEIFGFTME